ncbi:MAG: hypothetical protein DMD63_05560 [Gemmatimonadetes bacterium]|nr:MAG: hypothetical protein DMD63_05560 [Gemmatimonadota bacterium]
MRFVRLLVTGLVVVATPAQSQSSCSASASSLTPAGWRSPVLVTSMPPKAGLRLVREIPLPGPANRFDYQSVDPASGRIYMNHMNAGRTIVFDANNGKVVGEVADVPRATGVWVVPTHHQVYVSAAGNHEVAIIDDRTLKITSRVGGIRFPDGIAYASGADKVFVSDESGGADVVIDPTTARKRSTINLGGEAGNTHYDSVSHCSRRALRSSGFRRAAWLYPR